MALYSFSTSNLIRRYRRRIHDFHQQQDESQSHE
jgi:hypothetical protein